MFVFCHVEDFYPLLPCGWSDLKALSSPQPSKTSSSRAGLFSSFFSLLFCLRPSMTSEDVRYPDFLKDSSSDVLRPPFLSNAAAAGFVSVLTWLRSP